MRYTAKISARTKCMGLSMTDFERIFNNVDRFLHQPNCYVPGSKSITNRALLLATMRKDEVCLTGALVSEDTLACVAALQQLGVDIRWDNHDCIVQGCGGIFPKQTAMIDCHNAGTLARLLVPLCAAQPAGVFHFVAAERMYQRPMAPLLKVLKQQGAEFDFIQADDALPFIMYAHGLKGGEIDIDISLSSQFLSGLLLAAPLAQDKLVIKAGQLTHKPYVHMTKRMLADFNTATTPLTYAIEPDASTASYFFAIAALHHGRIHVPHLSKHGLQGDTRFLDLLTRMGCQVMATQAGVTVIGAKQLHSLGEIDMSGFSDTFMTMAALAVFCDRPTTITGLTHTRLQESDRVSAMAEELTKLQVKVTTTMDSITIYPSQPIGTVVHSHHDHRIAMSLAVIGTKVSGVVINGAESVAKTCPQFFEMLGLLYDADEKFST